MSKESNHPSEVIQVDKQHRMSFTFTELDRLNILVIQETERVTDRAFSDKRTERDVNEAVWWRHFKNRMNAKVRQADEKE